MPYKKSLLSYDRLLLSGGVGGGFVEVVNGWVVMVWCWLQKEGASSREVWMRFSTYEMNGKL